MQDKLLAFLFPRSTQTHLSLKLTQLLGANNTQSLTISIQLFVLLVIFFSDFIYANAAANSISYQRVLTPVRHWLAFETCFPHEGGLSSTLLRRNVTTNSCLSFNAGEIAEWKSESVCKWECYKFVNVFSRNSSEWVKMWKYAMHNNNAYVGIRREDLLTGDETGSRPTAKGKMGKKQLCGKVQCLTFFSSFVFWLGFVLQSNIE